MFQLLFAALAFAWTALFASDDGDGGNDDDGGNNDDGKPDPRKAPKYSDEELDRIAGQKRNEGKTTAEREYLEALDVESIDEAKTALAEHRANKAKDQTDAQRLEAERDAWKDKAERAEAEREKKDKALRERDRKDAILSALSSANYVGKTSHAIGAIDASFSSLVKEEDGEFDASEAVKSLSDDGFPGFKSDAPGNPPDPPRGVPQKTGETAADRFNERLKRRGPKAG